MESHTRSIVKTFTWRVVATVVTMCVAWKITGDVTNALVIGGFDTVIKVQLPYHTIDDAWLKRVGRLSHLRVLRLDGTQISDNGLKHLAGLSNLEILYLNDTQITDDGLKHLAGLSSLSLLFLHIYCLNLTQSISQLMAIT